MLNVRKFGEDWMAIQREMPCNRSLRQLREAWEFKLRPEAYALPLQQPALPPVFGCLAGSAAATPGPQPHARPRARR